MKNITFGIAIIFLLSFSACHNETIENALPEIVLPEEEGTEENENKEPIYSVDDVLLPYSISSNEGNDIDNEFTSQYVYDEKNRLIKMYHYTQDSYTTIEYDGDQLTKYSSSFLNDGKRQTYSRYIRYIDDTVFVKKDYAPFRTDTLIINDLGQIIKEQFRSVEGSKDYITMEYLYDIYNNLSKRTYTAYENWGQSPIYVSTEFFSYDNNKNVFANVNSPKWFLQYEAYVRSNINNCIGLFEVRIQMENNNIKKQDTDIHTTSISYNGAKYPKMILSKSNNSNISYSPEYISYIKAK